MFATRAAGSLIRRKPTFYSPLALTTIQRSKATLSSSYAGSYSNYKVSLTIKALVGSAVAIGSSMALGDVICQKILSKESYNTRRSIVMFVTGTFVTGPLSYIWQVLLEKHLPGTTIARIMQKTLANSIYAFTLSLPVMFTAVTLLSLDEKGERKTFHDAKNKIKADLVPTFVTGCFYWPFFNLLIFRFVPIGRRAVISSLIGTIWNIFLASVATSPVAAIQELKHTEL